jgi:hypothetical protein
MGKKTARLRNADGYQIWWLRFQSRARALGFDRLIRYREKYKSVVAAEAAAMKLSRMKLAKKADDTARSGGEDFDTPHRSVSDSSSDDMSGVAGGVASSDASSGVRSIATVSSNSRHSIGKEKKRKKTIESKVAKKISKLYDLCVCDEIAMKMARKAKGDGLEALRMIEKEYASSEVDRAEDLRSEMKDLDPERQAGKQHF